MQRRCYQSRKPSSTARVLPHLDQLQPLVECTLGRASGKLSKMVLAKRCMLIAGLNQRSNKSLLHSDHHLLQDMLCCTRRAALTRHRHRLCLGALWHRCRLFLAVSMIFRSRWATKNQEDSASERRANRSTCHCRCSCVCARTSANRPPFLFVSRFRTTAE